MPGTFPKNGQALPTRSPKKSKPLTTAFRDGAGTSKTESPTLSKRQASLKKKKKKISLSHNGGIMCYSGMYCTNASIAS